MGDEPVKDKSESVVARVRARLAQERQLIGKHDDAAKEAALQAQFEANRAAIRRQVHGSPDRVERTRRFLKATPAFFRGFREGREESRTQRQKALEAKRERIQARLEQLAKNLEARGRITKTKHEIASLRRQERAARVQAFKESTLGQALTRGFQELRKRQGGEPKPRDKIFVGQKRAVRDITPLEEPTEDEDVELLLFGKKGERLEDIL